MPITPDTQDATDAYVIGAGGHAKVMIQCLQSMGRRVVGVFDDDLAKQGRLVAGVPVLGTTAEIRRFHRRPAVIAIGNNRIRHQLAAQIDLPWLTAIHPHAYVDPSARLGPGTMVVAGVVIQCDAQLGHHVIVNTSATVDHDCQIGDCVHLCPGVHLPGDVTIDTGATMGTGAVCIPSVRIGAWTMVGAGSVVTRDLPEHVTAAGIPARVIRRP